MSRMQIRNLSVLNYGQGFTTWAYKGDNEDIAAMLTDGYFDDTDEMFSDKDVMFITSRQGTAMRCVRVEKLDVPPPPVPLALT